MDIRTSWTGKEGALPNVKAGTILLAALGLVCLFLPSVELLFLLTTESSARVSPIVSAP